MTRLGGTCGAAAVTVGSHRVRGFPGLKIQISTPRTRPVPRVPDLGRPNFSHSMWVRMFVLFHPWAENAQGWGTRNPGSAVFDFGMSFSISDKVSATLKVSTAHVLQRPMLQGGTIQR